MKTVRVNDRFYERIKEYADHWHISIFEATDEILKLSVIGDKND